MKLTTTLYTILALGATLTAAVPRRIEIPIDLVRRNDPVQDASRSLPPHAHKRSAEAEADPDPGFGRALGQLGKLAKPDKLSKLKVKKPSNPFKKVYNKLKDRYGKDPVPGSPAAQAKWRAMTGRYNTK